MDLFSPLSEAELIELDDFLLGIDNDESILCIAELDGLLTAVVSGPETIPPSEWLELVTGVGDNAYQWHSEQQFQHIFSLMMRLMNSIANVLMEAPQEFEALFMENVTDEKTYTITDEWCLGFMKGVALRAERWDEMPNALDDYLAPMIMFSSPQGWEQLTNMEDEEIEFWQRQIEPAVRRIHAYWLAIRSDELESEGWPMDDASITPFKRTSAKTGRNDPCPCGSGKKYKKCCGLH